jgi:CubicO group peptidase (beta-lactamase class C family)
MLDTANWTTRLGELARQARVPGAVLGIWADGQETVAACGVLNRATGAKVSTDSVFQVGSITKLWTASMIMQLIDEGLLSLDMTVAQALPGLRLGAADLAHRVTVAHLLTHTSGIDGDIFTDTGRGDDCIERYVGLLDRASSAFPPGSAYSYCNSGWVLLGRIIEVLDGRSWDVSLRERLCQPLELTETVTLPEEAILYRAAVGHRAGGARVRFWGLPRSVGPAGLIIASARDLLTFARFHLDGGLAPDGKRLLSEASVTAMQQPRTAIPDISTPGAAIGLGWRVYRWGGHTIIGHDGDTIGQSAYLRVDPRTRVAACLLTNCGQSGSLKRAVFTEVFGSLAGASMPAELRPTAGGTAGVDLGRHAGRYERTSRRLDVAVRDGQLHLLLTATGPLAALSEAQPEDLVLYPADGSGVNFVCRTYDHEPWVPVTFGELADGTPYLFAGGRITPRVALPAGGPARRAWWPCSRGSGARSPPGSRPAGDAPASRSSARSGCRRPAAHRSRRCSSRSNVRSRWASRSSRSCARRWSCHSSSGLVARSTRVRSPAIRSSARPGGSRSMARARWPTPRTSRSRRSASCPAGVSQISVRRRSAGSSSRSSRPWRSRCVTISLITDWALAMWAAASPTVSGPAMARCSSTARDAPGSWLRGPSRRWKVR